MKEVGEIIDLVCDKRLPYTHTIKERTNKKVHRLVIPVTKDTKHLGKPENIKVPIYYGADYDEWYELYFEEAWTSS